MKEMEFVKKVRQLGGRVFIVGGWVRDKIRGVEPHDKDYMVSGLTEAAFLQAFSKAEKVGRAFPVFLVWIGPQKAEVAFARKERKEGTGYRGFSVLYDPSVTLEEDLYRRDTTMNSLALELPQRKLFDLFGGVKDIKAHCIRKISEHFRDDPVRALRAARQAAEFGFAITSDTYEAMRACKREVQAEPTERIFAELRRALQADKPSLFFRALQRADLLAVTFPELAALIGQTQPPEYHPEGDAFAHTMLIVDTVAQTTPSLKARFCGLVHDLGKGRTPRDMLPHHYGHEETGVKVLEEWNARMTLPKDWLIAGRFVITEHMRAARIKKAGKIVDLLLNIPKHHLQPAEFNAVILADSHHLPPYLEHADELIAALHNVHGSAAPANLHGKAIGQWVHDEQIRVYQKLLLNSD